MKRTYRYDAKSGQMIEVFRERPKPEKGARVMRDIEPFTTMEGVEITSRSGLRAYEAERGLRQCGNDWTGSEKPSFWDSLRGQK